MTSNIRNILVELCLHDEFTDKKQFSTIINNLKRKHHVCVPNKTVFTQYRKLVDSGEFELRSDILNYIITKDVRSLSGVVVLTVATKEFQCPGKCVYCPREPGFPTSYSPGEAGVARGKKVEFDPIQQIDVRISMLIANGHTIDKIEIIIIGGTWSSYDEDYQRDFMTKLHYAINTYDSRNDRRSEQTLAEEQTINETSKYRIIGVTMETRPDKIDDAEIIRLRSYGCTRVQLGVQHTDDEVLTLCSRGHGIEASIQATNLLKSHGFKVDHHYMPGLPGSTPKMDIDMFKTVFGYLLSPDQIKIYPCIVNKHARLYKWMNNGSYVPYTTEQLTEILMAVKPTTPEWVRINRVIRDFPRESIQGGSTCSNLRQQVLAKMETQGLKCKCIRCREPRHRTIKDVDIKLKVVSYQTQGGEEYFISYTSIDETMIYGFIRVRINDERVVPIFSEIENACLIRELHVYGRMTSTRTTDSGSDKSRIQHKGIGYKLLMKAEEIIKGYGFDRVAIISGVGVREYYRKHGYELASGLGGYMMKTLE
jgi:ELP3 family radical SAM enzyme/protein acetyltransferase